MVGQFRNVEAMFEVQGVVNEFPISCSGPGNLGLGTIVVHGSEGFSDDQVSFQGGGDFLSEGSDDGVDMEILIFSFQVSDFPVIITGFNLVFPGESVGRPHVDSLFYLLSDVVFL